MNKNILYVIVIAAIVGIVASVVTTSVLMQASLSPSNQRGINAETCLGDENCEANNIQIIALSSNGNGYACIDSNGRVYKSDTPCVEIEIECNSNADCPAQQSNTYCQDSVTLCSTITSFSCMNEGTIESSCEQTGGGAGCLVCSNGCADGACVPGSGGGSGGGGASTG